MAPTTGGGKKRSATKVGINSSSSSSKKIRVGGTGAALAALKKEQDTDNTTQTKKAGSSKTSKQQQQHDELRDRFIKLLSEPGNKKNGISNSALKEKFGDVIYLRLVPIINELTNESRLNMSRSEQTNELFYTLVTENDAAKFRGLDQQARLVYQIIEHAGNMGIWTKDIGIKTKLQPATRNKIFKILENRRLIKPFKSVHSKTKKLYLLYDLTPSTELTGGVWYSNQEFDHEFISELRTFCEECIRRMNAGRGVTVATIHTKMIQAKVSRVELSQDELLQVIQTLVYDNLIEEGPTCNETGDMQLIPSRRLNNLCDFAWWDDVLSSDFNFRTIRFQDGVILPPHEPHYQTAL